MKTLGIGLAGARYIDVVDICVPPALHHSFAIREADAGKHIIKENPLTGFLERTAIPCLSERECRGLACEKARASYSVGSTYFVDGGNAENNFLRVRMTNHQLTLTD